MSADEIERFGLDETLIDAENGYDPIDPQIGAQQGEQFGDIAAPRSSRADQCTGYLDPGPRPGDDREILLLK